MKHFQDWVRNRDPGILVVDGHCHDISMGRRLSPISVFSASLAVVLTDNASSVVLDFFCSQHKDPSDELGGPRGLMRSLIIQIILSLPDNVAMDLSWINADMLEQLAMADLKSLCCIFTELFKQSERITTIFCILDNVCDFETSLYGWSEQMAAVFKTLQALVHNERVKPIFKLLETSLSTSRIISRFV